MLLGGFNGFLMEMSKHDAKPDIKTINLLLECCPQTYAAEEVISEILFICWFLFFYAQTENGLCLCV